MARKKRNGVAKGVPGRVRTERERKELEAKEHQMRVVCIRLQVLLADAKDTKTAQSPEAIAAIFNELRQLALAPRGFVSDAFRQQIWLFLVGRTGFESREKHDPAHFAARCGEPHRDDNQVEKDIERSLWYECASLTRVKLYSMLCVEYLISRWAMYDGHDRHYDTLRGIRESERRTKRRALTQIIGAVLRTNEQLHYYQVR